MPSQVLTPKAKPGADAGASSNTEASMTFGPSSFSRDIRGATPTLLETEWLLTDGSGGFAMGTAIGVNTRRYHGLLITATRPPVGRVMALNALIEQLVLDPGTKSETRIELSCQRFPNGLLHPEGWKAMARFEKDLECRWVFRAGDVEVVRTLSLLAGGGGVVVRYAVSCGRRAARLIVQPLVSLRDFHALLRRDAGDAFRVESVAPSGSRTGAGARIRRGDLTLDLASDAGRFENAPDWWNRFVYDRENERGYDCEEDLFAPGRFVIEFPAGERTEKILALHARLLSGAEARGGFQANAAAALAAASEHEASRRRRIARTVDTIRGAAPSLSGVAQLPALVQAADDFVVKRTVDSAASTTIIAGYPWFADWGRDTLISLPGLLLSTGRFDEARRTLETFARHTRRGLVPNVFDDYTGQPHYNTVDASLWFVHAACEYVATTKDAAGFDARIKGACFQIVDAYRDGTDFGIRMDPADGLIAAGDPTTQLTWMDAKRDGVVFTPRYGKAVEINSLWHHALRALADAVAETDKKRASEMKKLAEKVAQSFRKLFWNEKDSCLFDCLYPGANGAWNPSSEIRPNQIFSVSLAHCPLTLKRQQSVVACVREKLLTPHGLRTLAPTSPNYSPRYEGRMFERDRAYHNGTAWPWLIGAYVEALLRANEFSDAARSEARESVRPLLASLDTTCLGQIAEVYDAEGSAERPQRAGGCVAQAWSVAELLRAVALIETPPNRTT